MLLCLFTVGEGTVLHDSHFVMSFSLGAVPCHMMLCTWGAEPEAEVSSIMAAKCTLPEMLNQEEVTTCLGETLSVGPETDTNPTGSCRQLF